MLERSHDTAPPQGKAQDRDAGRAPAGHRPRSLSVAIGGLLVAVLLPLAAAGAAFVVSQWRQQRAAAIARLQENARTVRRAVDRELALDEAVLRTLAQSRDIDREDWRAFQAVAGDASSIRPDSWFLLYDRVGQARAHTLIPFGTAPLPTLRDAQGTDVQWEGRPIPMPGASLLVPFQTGEPFFTGLVYAPVVRRPAVGTLMPVYRGGEPRYALALVYGARFFERVLRAETASDLTS